MFILAGNWLMFILRGIIAILFGILTLLFPGMALLSLLLLFAIYAIFDGVLAIIAGVRRGRAHERHWWSLILLGLLGIAAGILTLLLPGVTALALLFLIAGWAIATGAMHIAAAIRLRRHIRGEWLLILSGILSIVFGIFIALFPGAGVFAVLLWIGAYAIIAGALLIGLGITLHRWQRPLNPDEKGHGVPAVA